MRATTTKHRNPMPRNEEQEQIKMEALERRIKPPDGVVTETFPAQCLPLSSTPIFAAATATATAASSSCKQRRGAAGGASAVCEASSNSLPSAAGPISTTRKHERAPLPDPPAHVQQTKPAAAAATTGEVTRQASSKGKKRAHSSDSSSGSTGTPAAAAAAPQPPQQQQQRGAAVGTPGVPAPMIVLEDDPTTASQCTTAEQASQHKAAATPAAAKHTGRKRAPHYTQEEDQKILAAVGKQGAASSVNWDKVAEELHTQRAPQAIRKRYKALVSATTSNQGAPAALTSTASVIPLSPPHSPRQQSASAKQHKVLTDFFTSQEPPAKAARRDTTPTSAPAAAAASSASSNEAALPLSATSAASQAQSSHAAAAAAAAASAEGAAEIEALKAQLSQAQQRIEALEEDMKKQSEHSRRQLALLTKFREKLISTLRENAQRQRIELMERVARESVSIGTVEQQRQGVEFVDVWRGGIAYKRAELHLRELQHLREELECQRPRRKRERASTAAGGGGDALGGSSSSIATSSSGGLGSSSGGGAGGGGSGAETAREEPDMALIVQLRINALKKEEAEVMDEMRRLNAQRYTHLREMRRLQDQESSKRNKYELLVDRYLLLNLLGKGGFSEVYSAFDLVECREVACKFHTLNPVWNEERKRTYIRHACREYNIHRRLNHPKVVQLYDVFEIDSECFCTVLELCGGGDLDSYIRQQGTLSEREARCIMTQIFSGLVYLNSLEQPIIHYDLKPGNILFTRAGEVKISDFGLSKVMDREAESMELTSQGAGTYWYLPPECFDTCVAVPKINPKVDVWSAGVIFYQMLYGKKPFGNNVTQQKFRLESMAKNAVLEFPAKPAVSQETKDFIARCFVARVPDRPDARTCYDELTKK